MSTPVFTPNATRDNIEVKPGQVWRDLDVRTQGPDGGRRTCTVISVYNGKAMMSVNGAQPYRTTTVSIRRMHKSATGWALVPEGGA